MLIQLTFFAIMICSVAALTIDLGMARLAQQQMQNAADTAALEGLRQKDSGDLARRVAARQMVQWTFGSGFGTGTGEDLRLGAGPDVVLTGGTGELNANQLIDTGASGVYKPNPQLNLKPGDENRPEGDMVSGTVVTTPPPGFPDASCAIDPTDYRQHPEDCKYNRADFEIASATASAAATAFLVRLRRTDGRNPLDRNSDPDPTAGVSSSGSSLPFLFGRATVIEPGDPAGYRPREHGITVRATAIADSRPALRVALPDGLGALGAPSFALRRDFWRDHVVDGAPITLTVTGVFGELTMGVVPAGYKTQPALAVGSAIAPLSTAPITNGAAYVPIYDETTSLVIGFGYVQVSAEVSGLTFTRVGGQVAQLGRATAVMNGGFGLTAAGLRTVLDAQATIRDTLLLAPVLVR